VLIGRIDEQQLLADRWRAVPDRGLQVVVLSGEAGIGKTSLLGHLVGLAPADAALLVRVDPLRASRPYGPFLDALAPGPVAAPARQAVVSPFEPRQAAGLDQLDDLVSRIVDRAGVPSLLVVDDLQWADAASLLLVAELLRRAIDLPLLVAVARRPGPPAPEQALLDVRLVELGDRVARLELDGLGPEDVRALAERRLDAPMGDDLSEMLAGTSGNPFLVEAVLDALDHAGRLERRGPAVEVTGAGPPPALATAIDERLALLTDPDRDLVRLAALLGPASDLDELVAVSGRSTADVLAVVQRLLDLRLLVADGDDLAFTHDLVREVVVAGLPSPLRRGLHRQVARALGELGAGPARVAEHLVAGARPGDLEAMAHLHSVGADLVGTDPAAAARFLEGALALCPAAHPGRDALVADLGDALAWCGRIDEARALAGELADRAVAPAAEAVLRSALARASLLKGSAAEAVAHQDRLVGLAEAGEGSVAWALAERASARLFGLDLDGALVDASSALAHAERGDEAAAEILARSTLAFAQNALGQSREALAMAQAAVDRADAGAEGLHRLHPNLFLGLVHQTLGHDDRAAAAFARGEALGRSLGARWADPLYRYAAATGHWDVGRWDDALAETEAAVAASEAAGSTFFRVFGAALRGLVLVHRGALAEAEAELSVGDALLAEAGLQFGVDWLLLARALLLEQQGDAPAAVEALRLVWESAPGLQSSAALALVGGELARLATAIGDDALAKEVVGQLAAPDGDPITAGRALAARGHLRRDPDALAGAADRFRALGRPWEAARHADAAARLLLAHDRPAAEALADQAAATYAAVGAAPHAAALDRALGRRGAPRARPRFGWGALTPSERRVCLAVAEGLTNQAIADAQGVSRRTVEAHLRGVYVKVGLSSRVALAVAVASPEVQVELRSP
jgi:DNA-binding CsgD family transcriptional regulator/tetratricopeptide (TPR) repeat protein